MLNLSLDPGAQNLLALFQQSRQPISAELFGKLEKTAQAKKKPLTLRQLEALLLADLPGEKRFIQQARNQVVRRGYHPDGKNKHFVSELIGLHTIHKERAELLGRRPVSDTPHWVRDPLKASFMMDKRAKSMLLFNARDVDANGRPLLMKIVLRVSNPKDKQKTKTEIDRFLAHNDLRGTRTAWGRTPDVHVIAKNQALVEIEDTQESEFGFGDPLLYISYSEKGKELGRGVAVEPTNEEVVRYYEADANGAPDLNRPVNVAPTRSAGQQLDHTPPHVFDHRIRLQIERKPQLAVPGSWLDTGVAEYAWTLKLAPGLIFEPKATASVALAGVQLSTQVPAADAFLIGSPPASIALDPALARGMGYAATVDFVLNQQITRRVQTIGKQDVGEQSQPVFQLLYPNPERISVAGYFFEPLSDLNFVKNELRGAPFSAHWKQGPRGKTQLNVKLKDGFIESERGTSIKGWQLELGFRTPGGQWHPIGRQKIASTHSSRRASFTVDVPNPAQAMAPGGALEIQIRNADGVPAERVVVPLSELSW